MGATPRLYPEDPETHPCPWLLGPRPGRKTSVKKKNPENQRRYSSTGFTKENQPPNRGAKKGGCSRRGVPDGIRKKEAMEIRARAAQEAKVIVSKMVENKVIDDDVLANEALEYVIGIVRSNIDRTDVRLRAATTVLNYCKQKPTEKKEHVFSQAETFLQSILEDESGETEEDDGDVTGHPV